MCCATGGGVAVAVDNGGFAAVVDARVTGRDERRCGACWVARRCLDMTFSMRLGRIPVQTRWTWTSLLAKTMCSTITHARLVMLLTMLGSTHMREWPTDC